MRKPPRASSVEARLAKLHTLDPAAGASLPIILDALRGHGILVAAAAKRVAEHQITALVEELPVAFTRLLDDPVKQDPQCRGKIAVARALDELGHWDDRVFVVGVAVVQLEGPVDQTSGRRDDTAAELRGVCGIAHVHFYREDVLAVLAGLLADPERLPRIAAAQGLGHAGRVDASALLRYKLLIDDEEDPEVLSATIESLLALENTRAIDFVTAFLGAHDDRAESAALALAGARVDAAYDALLAWSTACRSEQRYRVGYLALALLRTEPATASLVEVIVTHGASDAIAAATALATFKHDPTLAARIRDAGVRNPDVEVRRAIDRLLS